jgi:hypothetical protein
VTFKKIAGALFEKSAHSGIIYDLQIKFAIKRHYHLKTKQFRCKVTENRSKNKFRPNPSTTMGQKIKFLTKNFFSKKHFFDIFD